jgi:(1->4)-alpha-D-glucan 1-alpha-D-glucosylmutase
VTDDATLDQLCAHYGIAAGYRDAEGQERRVPDSTRRALLTGLGVPAGDARTERRGLVAALDGEWRRRLPPVVVLREDAEALELTLCLLERELSRPLRWRLTEEGGKVQEGLLEPGDLSATEGREIDGEPWTRRRLVLPAPRSLGYHRLELHSGDERARLARSTVIRTPTRCYLPEGVREERRVWGLATQLYAVRSARNWGIGDFTDLTRLVELCAESGAGAVALSPLHALFPGRPERCDPYVPSSRLFLNVLHIDVEAIPELAESETLQKELGREDFTPLLRALRAAPRVDYPAVARAKLGMLERLFRHFRDHHLAQDSTRAHAFHAFREVQGESLRRFALFEAIAEHLAAEAGAPVPPHDWPAAYRDPGSQAVSRLAIARAERVDFFAWLQWQAHLQLRSAGFRSLQLRLALGLCQDLAVGAAPDGAEVWADPDLFIRGASVGAPPDDFSPDGQDWGVLAWHPVALREAGYAPFAATLRANMREAGALRIDHVMGLLRLFLIPAGMSPTAGTYLAYPFEDLLGVLALESVRNRCLVIGDDLGTVPAGLPAALHARDALSLRVLYFQRGEDGGFLSPAQFERCAAVSVATHDLPTLAGFWQGTDLEQRRALGLFAAEEQYEAQLLRRTEDRARLLLALDHEALIPEGGGTDPVAVPELAPAHIRAVHVYLARSPARLLLIQTADLLGETEQVNLQGSADAYPNWCSRQPLEIEAWSGHAGIQDLLESMREERGVFEGVAAPPTEHVKGGTGGARIPRATYRLQLRAGFGFAAAADLVPYLAHLGISDCYFSPYLQARPGSTHGYDVIAHDRLNPELGDEEDYRRLCDALAAQGMGQILDMVPNHVGVMGSKNRWWLDVLENGAASEYANYFDIDWEPLRQELRGKVLIPVLGDHYGNVLDSGALVLVFSEGALRVEYYEHHFPIDPREYPRILAPGLSRLRERLGKDDADLAAFESLVTAFGNLPPRWRRDAEALAERGRDKELHKRRLAELCARSADLDWYVRECLRDYNGAEDYPADAGRLHALLESQAYRLAHWRVAADEINYRRFFDINDLAALRMENPRAFAATHALVLDLISQGKLQGLRIDHPDGLYDPARYLGWIQERVAAGRAMADEPRPLYIIVEKILVDDEQLPEDWPVHGTTGYDFAALVDALLVDPDGAEPLAGCYLDFAGNRRSLVEEIYAAKRLLMRNMLSSELHVLASELSRIAESDPHTRDYTLDALRGALAEVVACFPVYRTYISPKGVASRDRNQVFKAVSEARRHSQSPDLSVFGFVQDVMLWDIAEGKPEEYRERVLRLAMKLQQYTAPVMAKGMEDTAFYRHHRLVSLNEVGGNPDRFGVSIESFHRAMVRRSETWPHALLAGSTHDSKRSEDLRARLHVLSELPEEWREHVERWSRLNRRLRRDVGDLTLPDPNTEYLLYQTLLGVWPLTEPDPEGLAILGERVRAYMEKAVKEAKVHTAWTNPDEEYEEALGAFVQALFDPARNATFLDDFVPFQRRIARLGLFNALSQTLLRFTAPGVPDIYQGNELWSFDLVDPDNRRPVDFELRRTLMEPLEGAASGSVRDILENMLDGRAKLHLIRQALGLRRTDPELFERGDYRPLAVEGPHAERLCAYARVHRGRAVIALVPRLLAGLVPPDAEAVDPFRDRGWSATFVEVPGATIRDRLAGVELTASASRGRYILPAGEVLRRFPAGLLTCEVENDA